MPTPVDPFVLLDAGANPDSTPEMLQQYAVMGSIYSREILGVNNPSVGLLSIGGEAAKGNETTKKTFGFLDDSEDFQFNVPFKSDNDEDFFEKLFRDVKKSCKNQCKNMHFT